MAGIFLQAYMGQSFGACTPNTIRLPLQSHIDQSLLFGLISIISSRRRPRPETEPKPKKIRQRTTRSSVCWFLRSRSIIRARISHADVPPTTRDPMQDTKQGQTIPIHGTDVYRSVLRHLWPSRSIHHAPNAHLVFPNGRFLRRLSTSDP